MKKLDSLIAEIEQEAIGTQKILACVPDDKLEWQPHEKSSNLKKLATHIAQLSSYPSIIAKTDYIDFAAGGIKQVQITSSKDLVALSKSGTASSIQALKEMKEEDLEKEWTMKRGDHIIFKGKKRELIRKMGLSHLYHHRGQLGVYLRLLDIPIPGLYGPSADDRK